MGGRDALAAAAGAGGAVGVAAVAAAGRPAFAASSTGRMDGACDRRMTRTGPVGRVVAPLLPVQRTKVFQHSLCYALSHAVVACPGPPAVLSPWPTPPGPHPRRSEVEEKHCAAAAVAVAPPSRIKTTKDEKHTNKI